MRIRRRNRKKELAAAIERGRELLTGDKNEEALEFLEEIVQRFPEDAEIRLLYASTLLTFRPDDVAAEAAKAVELSPDDPVILVRAGHQLLGRGDVEAARACAVHANEMAQPGFVLESGLVSLDGLLAAIDGEDDLAEEKLRRALAEDPDYSIVSINLARFLNERNRQTEAIAVIDDALEKCRMKEGLKELREEILGTSPGDDEDRK
jgi:Tfp pilus assembly protein PilF